MAHRLVIIGPERESDEVKSLRVAAARIADQRQMTLTPLRTKRVRVVGEGWNTMAELLTPRDAWTLYRALHRSTALVLSPTAVHVRRNPSRDPAVGREMTSIADFVRYKATYGLIRSDHDIAVHLARFDAWTTAQVCTGEDDARILPLHVFETDEPWRDLGTPTADERFRARFGAARSRTDDGAKQWKRAKRTEYHGREQLTIAGHTLPPGMHWDVEALRRKATVFAAREVWQLKDSSAYLNVQPDGHVKGGRSSRGARIVWPKQRA